MSAVAASPFSASRCRERGERPFFSIPEPEMNLNQNHFELFGLPERFVVDAAALEARYRELQREVHPDRFAAAPEIERRASMQLATRVNEAYQTLKSPLRRAVYIPPFRGVGPEFETKTPQPPQFLLEQKRCADRREPRYEKSRTPGLVRR